jgi:dolichyl-phosphate-mannose--protein O-mannosyl transferase
LLLLLLAATVSFHARYPSQYLVWLATGEALLASAAAFLALLSGVFTLSKGRQELRRTLLFLLAVTFVVFLMHMYIIDSPPTSGCGTGAKPGCIMDEVYYVPAAQSLLSGQQCSPYADSCNMEHPFLAKAIIAAGIALFGFNDTGWRFFIALLGTLSIPLLFVLVKLVSGSDRLSYFSTLLFASDTLFFVHSSAALIDVPPVFFALLGFIFYFWGRGYWLLDRYVISGIFLGLSALSKETSLFFITLLVTYHAVSSGSGLRRWAYDSLKVMLTASLVFAVGLQVYDSLFASGSVPIFYQHVEFMLRYGSGLTGGGWTDAVLKTYITPLNWLLYYSPVDYFVTNVTVPSQGGQPITYTSVGYYGVPNFMVVWLVFAWVPVAVSRLSTVGQSGARSGEDRAALFALVWLAWTYVPYILLWLYGRVTYPFYLLPAIPALSIGAAYFITRDWFPRKIALLYLAATFLWFFYYFPVKDFLPLWLRELIGR